LRLYLSLDNEPKVRLKPNPIEFTPGL